MRSEGIRGGRRPGGLLPSVLFATFLFLLLLAGACDEENRQDSGLARSGSPTAASGARHVLVICRQGDSSSISLARHYAERRSLPEGRVLEVDVPASEEIPRRDYEERIENPVRAFLAGAGLTDSIDFIVLMRGIPLRIRQGALAVDASLGAMDLGIEPVLNRRGNLRSLANPYHGRREHFHRAEYGFYLVTRLDGYTFEDARALIDRSLAARPARGPFLLDLDPGRDQPGYREINTALRGAALFLRGLHRDVVLDESASFARSDRALAGYYSWGSNDASFDPAAYRSLRFLPGAIAETAVSTSGRTFRPTEGGQSLTADLIAQGVTGAKAYVSEPLSVALCRADILFERYVSGYTLAESFYMATPLLQWKDVVIGDPLCAPYARELP